MAKTTRLRTLEKQLKDAQGKLDNELTKIIEKNATTILNLNRRQLFMGVDSKGKSLGRYKSKWYAALKRTLNPRGVIDLILHGHFHKSFFIRFKTKPNFEIDAKDRKRNILVGRFGENIFGLTPESKKVFGLQFFKDDLIKFFRRVVHIR